jgi:hypothetical protein
MNEAELVIVRAMAYKICLHIDMGSAVLANKLANMPQNAREWFVHCVVCTGEYSATIGSNAIGMVQELSQGDGIALKDRYRLSSCVN